MAPRVKRSREEVKELLRPVIHNFDRRSVFVKGIDDTWAIDLVDMAKLKDKDYRYILCIVDVLSKYAWAVPLKLKTPKTTLAAIKNIIETSGRSPEKIWCDRGGEFHGVFAEYFNKEFTESRAECPYHATCGHNSLVSIPTLIKHFKSSTHEFNDEEIDKGDHFVSNKMIYHNNPLSNFHVSVVERFNKTLRNIMEYKFMRHGDHKWVDELPKWINKYNNSKHRATLMTPDKASEKSNEKKLLKRQNSYKANIDYYKNDTKPKFELGDRVRRVIAKGRFDKGYTQSWSDDIYIVVEVNYTKPITYRIERESDKKFELGSYYEDQLQLTNIPKPPDELPSVPKAVVLLKQS